MFRKLVSNLAFSPALVGQLGFYAKRLKKEESTRRIGLIFTALALIVQSFAVFSPPESANASSPADFVSGGLGGNINRFVSAYEANSNNIKDLFASLGITRQDILNTKYQTVSASSGAYNWALQQIYGPSSGGGSYTIAGKRTWYYWPLSVWGSSYSTDAFVGVTQSGRWFAIRNKCGNLLLKERPPAPTCPSTTIGTYPNCQPRCTISGKTNLTATDPNCKAAPAPTQSPTPKPTPTPMCTLPGKTAYTANDPRCKPDPVAACSSLKITKLTDSYQYTGTSTAANGATVTSYTFVTKKNGIVAETKTITASALTATHTYKTSAEGTYTVELTVNTSLGAKTGTDCIKSFTIAPPEKCPLNPSLPKTNPDCQPCPDDETIWIKDVKCSADVINTKTAMNITQGNVNATQTTAKASDKIIYTLEITNKGKAAADVTPEEKLGDVAEYATVIETGGGTYDTSTKTLSWPKVTVKPGEKQTRMFTIQMLDLIPTMGQGQSMPASYDCKMVNSFGNDVIINVDCPAEKVIVEQTVAELPHTGPRENMLFAGIVLAVVSYFWARSRQVKKEVRLIRRDLNAGTI